MGVVDIAMIGRVSSVDLAAAAIGHVYGFGLLIFGMGVLQALDPVISQAIGAKDHRSIGDNLQRAALVAALVSLPVALLSIPAAPAFALFGQEAELIPTATAYVHAAIPGIVPFLIFVLLRQTLQAFSRVRPVVLTILIANAANVVLNYALIFGHFGLPELGAVGCSWSTSACRWLMAALLLAFGWRELHPHLFPIRRSALTWAPCWQLLRLGAPIGAAFLLEYGAFMTTALLMGKHRSPTRWQVIRSRSTWHPCRSCSPSASALPAAVRVGYAVGRQDDPPGARPRGGDPRSAVGAAIMVVFGIAIFSAWPEAARHARTPIRCRRGGHGNVLLIPLAGCLSGLRRSASRWPRAPCAVVGETRTPLLVHLLGFWVRWHTPWGTWLAFHTGGGDRGAPWWGLVLGLAHRGRDLAAARATCGIRGDGSIA